MNSPNSRLSNAVSASQNPSASIVATGFAASTSSAPDWLGTTLGIAAAALSGLLIADFVWPRGGGR